MVQKSKGGKKCRSSLAGKKKRQAIKHHRKDNFKKKREKKIECCVCMEEISDLADNVITCGKVNHPLCRDCKMKCDNCPMCRSHSIKPPISQEVDMKILSSSSKHQNEYPKKQISVKVLEIFDYQGYGRTGWCGIYHEIRKDKGNYPVYKMIDEERYIIREKYSYDNICRWRFKKSPDNNYDRGWAGKGGKLFGSHEWSKTNAVTYATLYYLIDIQRL